VSLVRQAQSAREAAPVIALGVLLVIAAASVSHTPPSVLETVPAEFPAWAGGSGLSTHVGLRVWVSADGRPQRIQVIPYSTRHDLLTRAMRASFDSAAVRAVRQWRFRPATREGRPVAAWLEVEVPVAESWGEGPGGEAQMPDSLRWPAIWKALLGEWRRLPVGRTPPGHPSAIRFREGGRFTELDAQGGARGGAQGGERPGRFELSSDGPSDEMAARLTRIEDWAGAPRRVERMRFVGRDTLILCVGTRGECDTLVAVARGGKP